LILVACIQANDERNEQQEHSLSSAEVALATELGVHPKARPKQRPGLKCQAEHFVNANSLRVLAMHGQQAAYASSS
jgi:hypothetical protein